MYLNRNKEIRLSRGGVPRSLADKPWPWLANLVIYFFPWFFSVPTSQQLTLSALLVPAFLVLYLVGFYQQGFWKQLPFIGGFMILAFLGAEVMPTSSVFTVYAGAFAGINICNKAQSLITLVLIVAVTGIVSFVMDFHVAFWIPAIFFSVTTWVVCMASADAREKNAIIIKSQAETRTMAIQAERERIARDMHDVLGHSLSVIAVKAELAGKLIDKDGARAKSEIGDIHQAARQALADVRATITGMKSKTLIAEIATARQALNAADIDLSFSSEADTLPDALETTVALLIREAVTNVVRHADAQHCKVKVIGEGDDIVLTVEDDGKGQIEKEGNGLKGMRERVELLGGKLSILSDHGTRIVASLPLAEEGAS